MFGAKKQNSPDLDTSIKLNHDGAKRAQSVTGALLCHDRAIENTLLVALGAIATQVPAATGKTNQNVNYLLNCTATHSNDGTVYCKSSM